MGYNDYYINDFNESKYIEYLSDVEKMKTNLGITYLNQYNNEDNFINTLKDLLDKINDKNIFDDEKEILKNKYLNLCNSGIKNGKIILCERLALKESLDHYVLKKVENDASYINTEYFKNYMEYVYNIFQNKKLILNGTSISTELNTNVVFSNPNILKYFENKYYNGANLDLFINDNKKKINNIILKMNNNEKVNQDEINVLGDYIYCNKTNDLTITQPFLNYIFNSAYINEIKSSPQIMGALINCFAKNYTLDSRVGNSRMFISDATLNGLVHGGLSLGVGKYCTLEKSLLNETSLSSNKSIYCSRTFKENDLYWIMMISFHELTHEYQKMQKDDGKFNSSALCNIIKNVIRLSKTTSTFNEYNINHDSGEYEIEADEKSWRQCYQFLMKYLKSQNRNDILHQCKVNEKEVSTRRMFSVKYDKNGKPLLASLYDIKELMNIMNNKNLINHPKKNYILNYLNSYKKIGLLFNQDGTLNVSSLFENIINYGTNGEINNAGLEFGIYMLDNCLSDINNYIKNNKLSDKQINQLLTNICGINSENFYNIKELYNADFSNYNETQHNNAFIKKEDGTLDKKTIYEYWIRKSFEEVYNSFSILYNINIYQPNYDKSELNKTWQIYLLDNFNQIIQFIQKNNIEIDSKVYEDISNKYLSSNNQELMKLSSCIIQLKNQDKKSISDGESNIVDDNQVGKLR